MKINGVIQRKLAVLADYLAHLNQEMAAVSFEQFQKDWAKQRMVERSLQVMVEIVVDIAERLLAVQNAGPAENASDALAKIQTLGFIQDASRYAPMIRFRNFITHRYEHILPDILYSIVTKHIAIFDEFS